jgi:hypothetical protein
MVLSADGPIKGRGQRPRLQSPLGQLGCGEKSARALRWENEFNRPTRYLANFMVNNRKYLSYNQLNVIRSGIFTESLCVCFCPNNPLPGSNLRLTAVGRYLRTLSEFLTLHSEFRIHDLL